MYTTSCVSTSTKASYVLSRIQYVALHLVSKGDTITLSCSYTGSVNNLQWYRQYPRSKPEFLILITKSGYVQKPVPPRMSAQVQTDRMDLEISSAEVTDSALYYCALEPTVRGNLDTLYKNLSSALGRNQ
uniref:Ig-like domain-containing protein n=1 Tax=Salmo trutta TaxID=8032 RepID=A0A674F549_SALTR